MAKPMVVTLPFVLLLLDYWPLQRFDSSVQRGTITRLVAEKIPLLALSAASSVITFIVQRQGGAVATGNRLPLELRIENAAITYVSYIAKTFWPAHLAAYYPYPRGYPLALVIGSIVLLAGMSAAALLFARRYPYLTTGWFWYLGTLVPAIGIVQVGTQAMADRYTYIPLIGLFVAITWGGFDILSRWAVPGRAIAAAAGAIVLACTIASYFQARHWESSATLWTHALAVTSDNYGAHTYMGNALAVQDDLTGAIAQYREAIRILPDYPEAHNNLGPALARTGKLDEAVAEFREAIRLRPAYADAHSNLGLALASQGKLDEAITHYNEALQLDPDHAGAHGNLGFAYRALGRTNDAMREFETSLRINPGKSDVREALATLKAQSR
jgi:tetratricopeptide (TPR) repeat protein